MSRRRKIDFTKMRKGTVTRGTRTIEYCPACGRKGEKRVSTLGASVYGHVGRTIANDVGLEMIDACRVD